MTLTIVASEVTGSMPLPRKLSCALVILLSMTTVVVFVCIQTTDLMRMRIAFFRRFQIRSQINNNSLKFWNDDIPMSNGSKTKNSSKFWRSNDGSDLSSTEENESLQTCAPPRTLQILFWQKELGGYPGQQIELPCGGRCSITTDISTYNSSDAVVFQGDCMTFESFPRHRSRSQKWIYRSMEPPTNIFPYSTKLVRLKRQRNLYNVTSTYESSSDVATPYFHGSCSLEEDDEGQKTTKMNETERRLLLELISRKNRSIAWFVTHCSTSSRRERYVSQLRRYIPVDVFGGCGDLHCPLQRTGNVFSTCDDILERHYRFYLSFENSLCTDYITEKFWRLLDRDVIPVTLSAADYRKYVPQGTYIDIRDFRSPRHLAEYLLTLTRRDDLYAVYLGRKRRLRCASRPNDFATKLCYYLISHADREQTTDLSGRWNLTGTCQTPREFYRGIAQGMERK